MSEVFRMSNILCVLALLNKASFFALYEMACVFKARINPQSHRPCNLKGVALFFCFVLFFKQTELYPGKCQNESQTSYTLNFKCLCNTNVS